jgi:bifunctional non-homologous end joining protein LigD
MVCYVRGHCNSRPMHDGFRFIGRRDGDRIRVFSRGGHDWTNRLGSRKLRLKSVTIDGEGVCGSEGVTDFDRLRAAVVARDLAIRSYTRSTSWKLDGRDPRRDPSC